MKKRLIVALAIALIAIFAVSAIATADGGIMPLSSNQIRAYTCKIDALSGKLILATFTVTGTGTMDEIGASKMVIQKRAKGTTTWTADRTFTSNTYPSFVDYDTNFHTDYVSFTGIVDYEYRATVYVYATDYAGVTDRRDGTTANYATCRE